MINHSDYSCDKCYRVFSKHCKHCLHTADKPPTKFKPNKKSKIKEFERRTTMNNKTMYGLKLYIPFDELDTYIHNHIDEKYKDHTFIPVKVEVNDVGLDVEITLMSANPIEFDQFRYKLDLEAMTEENPNDQI